MTIFCRSPRVKELPPDLGVPVSVFLVDPVSVLLSELDELEGEESLLLSFFAISNSLSFVVLGLQLAPVKFFVKWPPN